MHEMVIYGVSFDMVGKQPIVLLKTADSNKFLPIWIGHPEAAAILMKLQGASTPRPMTHDLLMSVIGKFDAEVSRITVTDSTDPMRPNSSCSLTASTGGGDAFFSPGVTYSYDGGTGVTTFTGTSGSSAWIASSPFCSRCNCAAREARSSPSPASDCAPWAISFGPWRCARRPRPAFATSRSPWCSACSPSTRPWPRRWRWPWACGTTAMWRAWSTTCSGPGRERRARVAELAELVRDVAARP